MFVHNSTPLNIRLRKSHLQWFFLFKIMYMISVYLQKMLVLSEYMLVITQTQCVPSPNKCLKLIVSKNLLNLLIRAQKIWKYQTTWRNGKSVPWFFRSPSVFRLVCTLPAYTRGACGTESLTGIWDLQFNAGSERHSWGRFILSRICLLYTSRCV